MVDIRIHEHLTQLEWFLVVGNILHCSSKIQQRTLGHDHPHTVASLSNLATVYEVTGQTDRARAMHSLTAQMKVQWEKKVRRCKDCIKDDMKVSE